MAITQNKGLPANVGDLRNNKTVVSVKSNAGTIELRDELRKKRAKWERIEALIVNDEDAFKSKTFCHQLPNEQTRDYRDRIERFPVSMLNGANELISAPADSLWSNGYMLNFKNQNNGMMEQFCRNVTLGGEVMPYDQYLKDFVATGLRSFGTVFTVVDKPRVISKNRLEERKEGMPYLTNIAPLAVQNYEFVNGVLQWFAYNSIYRKPWINPMSKPEPAINVKCIWTRDSFIVSTNDGAEIDELSFAHNWGFVPVIIQASFLPTPGNIIGVSAFETSSNQIIQSNNYLNLIQQELYKHGSSLLMFPEEAMTAQNQGHDEHGESTLKTQDKGSTLPYAGEISPEYLTKDLQVDAMMRMAEFYMQAAIENERDLKSIIKKGTDGAVVQQSGFAKMLDREPLEANLAGLAEDLEHYSQKVFGMVSELLSVENDAFIQFDKNFDIRGFAQKLDDIERMKKVSYQKVSETGIKEAFKGLTAEITSDDEKISAINSEIDASTAFTEDAMLDRALDGIEDDAETYNDKKSLDSEGE